MLVGAEDFEISLMAQRTDRVSFFPHFADLILLVFQFFWKRHSVRKNSSLEKLILNVSERIRPETKSARMVLWGHGWEMVA